MKVNYKLISLVIVLIVVISFFSWKFFFGREQGIKKIGPHQAGEKLISYLNQKYLQGKSKAYLLKAQENKSGFYEINFKINKREYKGYLSLDGHFLFPEIVDLSKMEKEKSVEGGFKEIENQKVCREKGKPIVYFFSSSHCPHCLWEKPIIEGVVSKFKNYISFRSNIDGLGKDKEVFEKYSDGGVPLLVLGCKYYRLGSGENIGKEQEKEILTKLICKITDNNPQSLCKE